MTTYPVTSTLVLVHNNGAHSDCQLKLFKLLGCLLNCWVSQSEIRLIHFYSQRVMKHCCYLLAFTATDFKLVDLYSKQCNHKKTALWILLYQPETGCSMYSYAGVAINQKHYCTGTLSVICESHSWCHDMMPARVCLLYTSPSPRD